MTAFKFRDHDGHPLELLAFPEGRVPGQWRAVNGTGPFLGIDHTAIAISDSARSARFFGSVFGFKPEPGPRPVGPNKPISTTSNDVHVSVTRLAPDLPAPRLELLHYHVGTRRPVPPGTASNDIVATHCAVRVASLTRPPRRSPAAARPWPTMTSWSCTAASAPPWYRDLTGTASWPKSRRSSGYAEVAACSRT